MKQSRGRILTATLRKYKRKENVIQSDSEQSQIDNKPKPKEYINKYMISEIMKTADDFYKRKYSIDINLLFK